MGKQADRRRRDHEPQAANGASDGRATNRTVATRRPGAAASSDEHRLGQEAIETTGAAGARRRRRKPFVL
jgi:hypothetical protein